MGWMSRSFLAGVLAWGVGAPAHAAEQAKPSYSGIYPHLAVTNTGRSECGIGAIVPWADKLWLMTYPAHQFKGSDDKLYEVDASLNVLARPESVGGTHANRMIHRESKQLIVGPYFVDEGGKVRAVAPVKMPGRLTATARHLTDPANKVYFFTMEQGLYEVDVHTLDVKTLNRDGNISGQYVLPGRHGKGAYTGQGRLIVANNGMGGVLAEWDGKGDPSQAGAWTIVDRNKYTDITGPGGIEGAADSGAPVWALGWDAKSVLLNVRDDGRWTRFRLPKASYTHDADPGWYTEWPRVRAVSPERMMMDMHGMFYDFPRAFGLGRGGGIRPIATHLKMVVDFADWNGRLVMAADDASMFENPLVSKPQSNLWLGSVEQLGEFGRPAGWGGVWLKEPVRANQPSEAFLLAGFEQRGVHLSQDSDASVTFTLEVDERGDGGWTTYTSLVVPARGYVHHVIPATVRGEWIRIKTDADVNAATAYFHYLPAGGTMANAALFRSLAAAEQNAQRSEGILLTGDDRDLSLHFAANVIDESGKLVGRGHYVIGEDMRLRREESSVAERAILAKGATKQEFEVDAASVIMADKGKRYRLPKGPAVFDGPTASGWRRGVREIVTERGLMNIQGTFYELPREQSGGLAKVRPICTHNRMIYDFASWRGMLVLSGNQVDMEADAHYVRSEDGKVGLWFGNVDDLWKLGQPRGTGGPWRNTKVRADVASDPYLMTGYDRKIVHLSHDQPGEVRFTIEVDFAADGSWHGYKTLMVPAGQTVEHAFPAGYAAHWVRVKADRDCAATAWFVYNPAE